MADGSLAVVEAWLQAVNDRDGVTLESLSGERVRIVGPRGRGQVDRQVLSEWLSRAGFSADPVRWFCGADGGVVVEHDGAWHDRVTGQPQDRLRNASRFLVVDGVVTDDERHDDGVGAALAAARLTVADEVTARGEGGTAS